MIFVFFLKFLLASIPSITICEGDKCQHTQLPDSMVFDMKNPENCTKMYQKIANHIGRSKDVNICFAMSREIEIPLSLFLNHKINIVRSSNEPSTVILSYDDDIDYSSTSINNEAVEIIFKYIGKKEKTDLKLRNLIDTYNSKEMNPRFVPVTTTVTLLSYYLLVSAYFLDNLEEIVILDATALSKIIIQNEDSSIEIKQNMLQISSDNMSLRVMLPKNPKISIAADSGLQSNNLILNLQSPTYLNSYSLIEIKGFESIILDEEWPKDSLCDLIINSISLSLTSKSTIVPFNIIATSLNIYLTKNSEISGKIIVDTQTNLHVINNDLSIINLRIKSVEKCKILVEDFRFNINIDKYSFNSDGGQEFPIYFAISKKNISRVEIKEMNISTINEAYPSLLMIKNQMDSDPQDKEVVFLTSGNTPFYKFPNILFYFWNDLKIQYTSNSNRVHAFQNGENAIMLKHNMISYTNQVVLCTYGDRPSIVKTNICISKYSNDCREMMEWNIFDDGSDLDSLYGFNENNLNFTIYYGDTDNKVIGLQNIKIHGMSISLIFHSTISQEFSQVNIKFPSDKSIIKNFEVKGGIGCGLLGDINFNCHSLSLNTMIYIFNNENFVPNFDNCDSVEIDLYSIETIKDKTIKNLTIIDPTPFIITYLGASIIINNFTLKNDLINNLTIVGNDFTIINMADNIFKGSNIVLNEDAGIKIRGDWSIALEKPVKIYGCGFKATVYIDRPSLSQYVNLEDIQYTLMPEYTSPMEICLYKSDPGICSLFYPVNFQIDNWIDETKEELDLHNSFKLLLLDFTDDDPPVIDLNIFKKKQVTITSVLNTIQPLIVIPSKTSDQFTSCIFQLINLSFQTNETFYFNHIRLEDSIVEAAGHNILAKIMECSPKNLVGWDSIIIQEKLIVIGNFPDDEFIVKFSLLTSNIEDFLTLEPTESSNNIILGDDYVRIKNGTFIIPEVKGFPVVIRTYMILPIVFNISFFCAEGATKPIHCRLYFPEDVLSLISVIFEGEWEKVDHQFEFNSMTFSSLYVASYININVTGSSELNLIATTPNCGINGFCCCRMKQYNGDYTYDINVKTTVSPDTIANFTVKELRVIESLDDSEHYFIPFNLKSSNLLFNILHYNNMYPKEQVFSISFFIDENGASSCRIHEHNNLQILDLFIIEVQVTGPLKNESEYRILRENLTILTMPASEIVGMSPLIMGPMFEEVTHSFLWILETESVVIGDLSSIFLFPTQRPSQYPYKYLWDPNFNEAIDNDLSEILLFEEQIPTCFQSISYFLQNISIELSEPVSLPFYFQLSDFDENFTDVNITMFSDKYMFENHPPGERTVSFDKPGVGINEMHLIQLDFIGDQNITFENIKVLDVTYCTFDNGFLGSEIKDVEKLTIDFASFLSLIQKTHLVSNNLDITITDIHYIGFMSDGFEIKKHHNDDPFIIRADDYKSVKFRTSIDIELMLLQGSKIKRIRPLE